MVATNLTLILNLLKKMIFCYNNSRNVPLPALAGSFLLIPILQHAGSFFLGSFQRLFMPPILNFQGITT